MSIQSTSEPVQTLEEAMRQVVALPRSGKYIEYAEVQNVLLDMMLDRGLSAKETRDD